RVLEAEAARNQTAQSGFPALRHACRTVRAHQAGHLLWTVLLWIGLLWIGAASPPASFASGGGPSAKSAMNPSTCPSSTSLAMTSAYQSRARGELKSTMAAWKPP